MFEKEILDLELDALIKFVTLKKLNLFDCLYFRKINNRPFLIPFESLVQIIEKYDIDTVISLIFELITEKKGDLNCIFDIKSYYPRKYNILDFNLEPDILNILSVLFPFPLFSFQFYAIQQYIKSNSEIDFKTKGIVVTAPTGMGKSLTYIIPILISTFLLKANSIIIYPMKALINDQFSVLIKLQNIINSYGIFFQVSIIDGDTKRKLYFYDEYKLSISKEKFTLYSPKENLLREIDIEYRDNIIKPEIHKQVFTLEGGEDKRFNRCPFCNEKSRMIYLREKKKYIRGEDHAINPFSICLKCNKLIFSPWSLPEINIFRPQIILTTPDMLHGVLQNPDYFWIFQQLTCIGIDEIHTYRGYLGINTHYLIKRLLEICRSYGIYPQIIGTSATITNPVPFFSKITNIASNYIYHIDFKQYLEKDYEQKERFNISPNIFSIYNRAGKFNILFTPSKDIRKNGKEKLLYSILKIILFHSYIKKIIIFGDSRQKMEELARDFDKYLVYNFHQIEPENSSLFCYKSFSEKELAEVTKETLWNDNIKFILDIKSRVHKGALSAEKRVEIESSFKLGEIDLIFATPTMELGIDIGDLDCAILYGLPNELDKFIQRIGRVGRKNNLSLIITFLKENLMDSFFLKKPEELYKLEPVDIPLNLKNTEIIALHEKASIMDFEALKKAKRGRSMHKIFRINFRNAFQSIDVIYKKEIVYSNGLDQIILEINGECEYYYNKKAYYAKPVYDTKTVSIGTFFYKIPSKIELIDDHPKKEYQNPPLRKIIKKTTMIDKYIIHIINLSYIPFIGYNFETTGNIIHFPKREKYYQTTAIRIIIQAISVLIEIDKNLLDYLMYSEDDFLLFEKGIGGYGITDFFKENKKIVIDHAKKLLISCDCEDGCPKCIPKSKDLDKISKGVLIEIIEKLIITTNMTNA